MPKQVDHEERRRTIAEAVVRVVSTHGVEAASLRAVAAEAGVSMGAVQHYFTTRDEMLRFALAHGNTLLAERGARLLAEQMPTTPRAASRLFCILLLPLDVDSRTAARVRAALISHACVDEPTRELAAMAYANLTDFVVRRLSDAVPDTDVRPLVDRNRGVDISRPARPDQNHALNVQPCVSEPSGVLADALSFTV